VSVGHGYRGDELVFMFLTGGEQRDHGIASIDRRWEPRLSFTRDVRIGRAYGKCRIKDFYDG
jgi:hypothetical protein